MYRIKVIILAPQVNIKGYGSMSQFLREAIYVAKKGYNLREILVIDEDFLSGFFWLRIPYMLRFYLFVTPILILHFFGRKFKFIAISQEYVLPFNFKKQVCIHHDIIQYFYGINLYKKFIYRFYLKWILPKLEKVYFVSQSTKEITKKVFHKDCRWVGPIYVPLQLSNFDSEVSLRDNDFIWVGAVSRHKRLEMFLKALTTMNKRAKLVIPEKSIKSVEMKLIENGLEDSVTIHSNLSSNEFANLLMRSKVLVNTSRIEGFGMPVLEALHSGCKVVCANTPINIELFKKYAFLYQKNNFQSLCFVMKSSLENGSNENVDFQHYRIAHEKFLSELSECIHA